MKNTRINILKLHLISYTTTRFLVEPIKLKFSLRRTETPSHTVLSSYVNSLKKCDSNFIVGAEMYTYVWCMLSIFLFHFWFSKLLSLLQLVRALFICQLLVSVLCQILYTQQLAVSKLPLPRPMTYILPYKTSKEEKKKRANSFKIYKTKEAICPYTFFNVL